MDDIIITAGAFWMSIVYFGAIIICTVKIGRFFAVLFPPAFGLLFLCGKFFIGSLIK